VSKVAARQARRAAKQACTQTEQASVTTLHLNPRPSMHQDRAAQQVDAVHRLLVELHGLGGAVVEAAQAIPDPKYLRRRQLPCYYYCAAGEPRRKKVQSRDSRG